MNRKITIREIAEHCGVSMATVSRAINGNSYVGPELRRKIREYLEDVGWEPRNLSEKIQRKLNTEIVVVASSNLLSRPSTSLELKLLVDELYRAGFQPVIRLGHRSDSLRWCLEKHPSMVIVLGFSDRLSEALKKLKDSGVRVFGIGETHTSPCPLVMSDHFSAGCEAAEVLRKNGCRKVALFTMMGAKPHPENLEKIYSRSVKIIEGILARFPEFDYRTDAVSDCFGDLSEFKRMFASGMYDGWILGDSQRLKDLISLEGAMFTMEKNIVLLQENPMEPVPPVCLKVYAENSTERIRTLVKLIQKPFGSMKSEYLVPYFGMPAGRKNRIAGREDNAEEDCSEI